MKDLVFPMVVAGALVGGAYYIKKRADAALAAQKAGGGGSGIDPCLALLAVNLYAGGACYAKTRLGDWRPLGLPSINQSLAIVGIGGGYSDEEWMAKQVPGSLRNISRNGPCWGAIKAGDIGKSGVQITEIGLGKAPAANMVCVHHRNRCTPSTYDSVRRAYGNCKPGTETFVHLRADKYGTVWNNRLRGVSDNTRRVSHGE